MFYKVIIIEKMIWKFETECHITFNMIELVNSLLENFIYAIWTMTNEKKFIGSNDPWLHEWFIELY